MASPTTALTPRRARPAPQGRPAAAATANVGDVERLASVLGGGALAAWGLVNRSWGSLALAVVGSGLIYRGSTGHCPLYQTLGVSTADRPRGPDASIPAGHGIKVEEAMTINRPATELYRFWRKLENLPRFMAHLEAVRESGPNRSHWVVKAPLGTTVEWEAEVITDRAPEVIGWKSLPGAEVDTAGSVHFTPAAGGRGTEVRVVLKYDPPGGAAGAAIAKLLGEEPHQQVREDLRRFKQLMEAREIPTTRGQPTGRASS